MVDQRDYGDENDYGRPRSVDSWKEHIFRVLSRGLGGQRTTGFRWLILRIPGPSLRPRVVEPDPVYEQMEVPPSPPIGAAEHLANPMWVR